MKTTRRDFVRGGALVSVAAGLDGKLGAANAAGLNQSRPVVLAAGTTIYAEGTRNRLKVTDKAMQMLRAGADPLDAVVAAVKIVEDDPRDMSVGLGGLPNEDGEVELDASVMHGPTKRAGAVAAIKNIKEPIGGCEADAGADRSFAVGWRRRRPIRSSTRARAWFIEHRKSTVK